MDNKKILDVAFVGSYAKGTLHQTFDTCFLHALSLCSNHVDCYKDKTTFSYIYETNKRFGYLNNVTLHDIRLLSCGIVVNYLWSALLNIWYYIRCSNDIICYAYNNQFSLHVITVLNKLFHKKIIICCHGEMELLINQGGGYFARLSRFLLKNYFQRCTIDKNIRFVVLGDSIKKNLKCILPDHNWNKFASVDHPFYLNNNTRPSKPNGIVHFGLLGTVSLEKGFNTLISFEEELRQTRLKYKISIIGRAPIEKKHILEEHNIDVTWDYLPRCEFEKRILNIDCVLFFYPSDSYKLIASGTIFDAIGCNKPIIALKNDFFEYIIGKTNYPSLLLNDVNEIIEIIQSGRFYTLYDKDFFVSKRMFEPREVCKQINRVINEVLIG